MTIATYEGIVEKGKIRLKAGANLPENAKVYVIVTDAATSVKMDNKKVVQVLSPRLVHPKDAERFKLTVTEETLDA